jgi:type IV secretory pathway VirB2 component (pilin)
MTCSEAAARRTGRLWRAMIRAAFWAGALAAAALLGTASALAGSALPWDSGLTAIGSTLTGAVAVGVGIIAVATVGIAHAIGADISGAVRGVAGVAIIIAMAFGASTLIQGMGVSGGLVP